MIQSQRNNSFFPVIKSIVNPALLLGVFESGNSVSER